MDIYEGQNELVAKVDLPGVEEKDIDIRLENNTLTIRGERKFEKSVNEDNYLRVERAYGSFTRTFSLPNTVNAEGHQRFLQAGRIDRAHAQARRVQAQAGEDQRFRQWQVSE